MTDEEFDIEDARAKHDLIVEVSVAMRTAYERFYSGDILGERWIRIDLAHQANAYHSVYENLLSLLARAGMSPLVGPPRITTSASLTEAARTRLGNVGIDPDEDLVISLHPGSGRAFKCWPARSFGALARELQESLGAKIVLVIGREEHALLNELALDGVCCELVSDEDSLTQVQGLLAQSTLHVGNDSGLTHLAVACGTPVVALFGPTDPGKWGPAHGLRRVVIARDSSGRRSKRMRSITVPEVHDAIASLLRDVVRERPRCASMKLRQHPQAQRVDAGWATRGARLEAPGESGSILTALATMCERGAAWSALVQRFGEDLCEVASASEVITQAWAANDTVVHALTPRPRVESIGTPPPRVAYVVESGFQHAFGVIAMLAVMPGRVFTSGTRIGDRLSSLAEVVVLNNDREIGAALADHGVDVVVSTSQRIKPASLRDAAGRRKVVFIGHGESDKTRGQGPTPGPGFVHARVNEEFDLVLVASHFHMARHRNPRRRLVGYMKHDLFVRDGYSQRRPRNGWILWAPGWGRHSSLEPWLDRVLDVSQRLGLSCMLHPHPHSYEAEPRLIQRVQAEVIRHRHFSIAHCANVLDAMAQCEVMLGDVSSVGYDWLMFDRPAIVLDHPGLSVDDERSLFGTGACVTSCTGLERALREAAAAPDKQGALRRAALEERFFSLDGCAAERARDAILELWAAPSRG
ncbi:MAG: glycosyltransferase family 9 protein [Nannocystaceae bacterium]|nr:glycosyltransferase family 9 protein [Nannocystaceae bacterium]